MNELLKALFSVANCLGIVSLIEEVILPELKDYLNKLKGNKSEEE